MLLLQISLVNMKTVISHPLSRDRSWQRTHQSKDVWTTFLESVFALDEFTREASSVQINTLSGELDSNLAPEPGVQISHVF